MSQAYTRYIKTLRLLLPAVAVIALLGLLIWPWWREHQQTLIQQALPQPIVAPTPAKTASPLQVLKPEYQGTDKSGRPYRITADRVEQALDPKDPLLLVEPRAALNLQADQPDSPDQATLRAAHGLYDQQAQTIDLKGRVVLDYAGYTITSDDLALDLIAGAATTTTPVQGDGPAGSIQGQALSIADKGARIVLKGPGRIVLHSKTSHTSSDPVIAP